MLLRVSIWKTAGIVVDNEYSNHVHIQAQHKCIQNQMSSHLYFPKFLKLEIFDSSQIKGRDAAHRGASKLDPNRIFYIFSCEHYSEILWCDIEFRMLQLFLIELDTVQVQYPPAFLAKYYFGQIRNTLSLNYRSSISMCIHYTTTHIAISSLVKYSR